MKKFENFTAEDLWKLRQEISLNSLFIHDYENSFRLDPHSVCEFFDSYAEYLWDLICEEHGHNSDERMFSEYDTKENLWDWYNCYEDFSWVKYVE